MSLSEFALIEKYFSSVGKTDEGVVLGVGDDAALLELPQGEVLVTSTDTLVSGVHFPDDAAPADIASRLLRVNLSDMAAMGATPRWFTLALTLPGIKQAWLESFSSSLASEAAAFGCQLVGGDTTAGLLTLSLTMLGTAPRGEAILRSSARPGDHIFVTGCLGDGAAALAVIKGLLESTKSEKDYLHNRFYRPQPRLKEGHLLRGLASSAIDISDGLLADLGHIVDRSEVGAEIFSLQLPVSDAMLGKNRSCVLSWALTGGDDYELCFTVPEGKLDLLNKIISSGELVAAPVGRIISGSGVKCWDDDGALMDFDQRGYQHF